MTEYQEVQNYIIEIQKLIRWKRARKIATKELEIHIQDQINALISKGYNEADAVSIAITSMGPIDKIGKELDAAYRPSLNVCLLVLTLLFLTIGIFVNIFTCAPFSFAKAAAIIVGIFIAFIAYLFDYTILIRYPKTIYFVHLFITIALLLFEGRNGLYLVDYTYSFYLIMLYPITVTGISLYIGSSKSNFKLLWFFIAVSIPILCAFLISSIPAVTILLCTSIIIFIYGSRKHWFELTPISVVLSLSFLLVLSIIIFFSCHYLNIRINPITESSEFIQNIIRDSFSNISLYGEREFVIQNQLDLLIMTDYPIIVLLLKYGYLAVGIVLLCFTILIITLYKSAFKQKTDIGTLLSLIICSIISIQFVLSVFCNFGIVGRFSLCFPFIASGGLFTIYNLLLIGIMLSVSRNETIAQNWLSYKEKRGIYVS